MLTASVGAETAVAAGDTGREAPVQTVRRYDREAEAKRYDELLRRYGRNKVLPPGFELQALLALSHYPELENIRIEFIVKDTGIPISSRPRPLSVFRAPHKRRDAGLRCKNGF